MRHSATFSEAPARAGAILTACFVMAALALSVSPALAKVFMTQDEALALAFPGEGEVERHTTYLTDGQAEAAAKKAGAPVSSKVIAWYSRTGRTAWFDTHVVRTLPETVMIVVDPNGAIERIDILSFSEPEDYKPRERWFDQLRGRALDDDLSVRKGIRPISGATLSGRAIVGAARRALALREVILAEEKAP